MANSHLFFIEQSKMQKLNNLFLDRIDGAYVVLTASNGFADIAQYVSKYDNIRIICVRADKLNPSLRM